MEFGKADREYRGITRRREEIERLLRQNHKDIQELRKAQAQMLSALLEQAKERPGNIVTFNPEP